MTRNPYADGIEVLVGWFLFALGLLSAIVVVGWALA